MSTYIKKRVNEVVGETLKGKQLKNAKILLVLPESSTQPQMSLMLISAALKRDGFKNITYVHVKGYKDALKKKPHIVGFTTVTESVGVAIKFAEQAKKVGAITILGGIGVAVHPRDLTKNKSVDYVIKGEVENNIGEIITKILNGKQKEKTISLGFIRDLDSLPFADRSVLDMNKFPVPITLSTSRGCPYNCIYCSKYFGNLFRGRSPHNVLEELKYLIKEYEDDFNRSGRIVAIQDDIFNYDLPRAKKILKLIINENLNINLMLVAGLHVRNVDAELFHLLKKAGSKEVWFGIESGDEEVLKKLGKGIDLDMVRRAVKLAKDAKIPLVGGHMLIGLPGNTPESEKRSLEFAKSLKLNLVSYNHVTQLPGTRLWNWVEENGKSLYKYFDEYTLVGNKPAFETKEFTSEERKKAYDEAVKLTNKLLRLKALRLENIIKFIKHFHARKVWRFLFQRDLRAGERIVLYSKKKHLDPIRVKK
ncbi:hypothetical protein COS64_00405 [archaeon CG06_land_8_20_14_3_00_37_11]|nr:MAG: hypothetical protein COS64_00405 [archaeon CG06_land_8_20_14_3_00_37_11]